MHHTHRTITGRIESEVDVVFVREEPVHGGVDTSHLAALLLAAGNVSLKIGESELCAVTSLLAPAAVDHRVARAVAAGSVGVPRLDT
jgi:hypothetical protein